MIDQTNQRFAAVLFDVASVPLLMLMILLLLLTDPLLLLLLLDQSGSVVVIVVVIIVVADQLSAYSSVPASTDHAAAAFAALPFRCRCCCVAIFLPLLLCRHFLAAVAVSLPLPLLPFRYCCYHFY